MKGKDEYTDVTITCNRQKFSAHRLILAARIPHFRKILPSNVHAISLNQIHPDVLKSLIDFAYEGKLKVTSENMQHVLLAFGYFRLDRVQKACWEFLQNESGSDWEQQGACVKPLPSDVTIREKFDEFSDTPEFLFLPYSSVKDLLTRDDLIVKSEEKVFEATMTWVKACPVERLHHLPHLLTEIRMANLPPDFLVEKVATEQMIQTSDRCRHMVEDAKSYHLLPGKRSLFPSFKTGPRLYTDSHQNESSHSGNTVVRVSLPLAVTTNPSLPNVSYENGLYVVRWHRSLGTTVMQYESKNKEWSTFSSNDPGESVHAAVYANSKIYVFSEKSLKSFCLVTREWTSLGDLLAPVSGSGIAASHNGPSKIYVFGGHCLPNRVRCFDVHSGLWCQQEKDMDVPRRSMGVVGKGKYVYLTGGFSEHCCDVFEKYSVVTEQWTRMSCMLSPRMGHDCADLDHKIYVCGGFTDNNQVLSSTVESYDKISRQWITVQSPHLMHLQSISVASWNGKLYAIAAAKAVDKYSCFVYEPENSEWDCCSEVAAGRKGLTLMKAVVVCPPEQL